MKIYYTTSKLSKNDYSYYGLFAQDGDNFYELSPAGLWEKQESQTAIDYYKTCDKIDIEEYVKEMNNPEKIKLFSRTKGTNKGDKSFVYDSYPVICTLPDGGLLCLRNKDRHFEKLINEKQCPIRTIEPRYAEDGNFSLTDTDTSIIPKDIVDDAICHLEETLGINENDLQ